MSSETELFQYELPKELIAQEPLRNRADARLMVLDRKAQSIRHLHVRDLPDLLESGDRLVLNNTKVVPAQLLGKRVDTGGRWQGLFLSADQEGHWRLVCKTRGHLKAGDCISLFDREGREADKLWLLERLEEGQWLAHLDSDRAASDALEDLGRVPLPHYIRGGHMVDSDLETYQTVFARHPGAVAAPTAGLHFTKLLLERLERTGISFSPVTLHVGLGTFRPIKEGAIEDHKMHSEWCELSDSVAQEINATRASEGRVVAVGTTSVRTLETAARKAEGADLKPWRGDTDLFLRPPCDFLAVDAMMTNFHFPGTTLLLMVQAFAGTDLIRAAYTQAVKESYRFYSYGDAMLIL